MPVVVVMDDDAGTRMLVSQILRKDGYEVFSAEDGEKGRASRAQEQGRESRSGSDQKEGERKA